MMYRSLNAANLRSILGLSGAHYKMRRPVLLELMSCVLGQEIAGSYVAGSASFAFGNIIVTPLP